MSVYATKIVNLKVESYDVYIGRAGKGQDGYFGNPFPIGTFWSRERAIRMYAPWFAQEIERDPEFRRRVLTLNGKTLGCFCAPPGGLTKDDKPFICHGQ